MKLIIGKVFSAPTDVIESGTFIVVAQDPSFTYNPARKPWFLQVREYKDGVAFGPWISVGYEEFKKWNPDVSLTSQPRNVGPDSQ